VGLELLDGHRAGFGTAQGGLPGQLPEQIVDGGGDAVQAPEERNFAI
jgi:hypothetical protein